MLARVWLRRLVIFATVGLLLAGAIRLLAIKGWLAPARIVSGSMANTWKGEHFQLACSDCGFLFTYGIDSKPPLGRATCPNCGFGENHVNVDGRRRGDRVLIDRGAYWFEAPERFDVVVFRDSERPGRWFVKRIVGLPGEHMSIREGDLLADGRWICKSMAEFRNVAVLVHDNRFQPRTAGLPKRWRPEKENSSWRSTGNGFRFVPENKDETPAEKEQSANPDSGDDHGQSDPLVYHHWRCYASTFPRSADAPISDNAGYNQDESRELRSVSDIVLRLAITGHSSGRLEVRVHDGREWMVLRLVAGQHEATILRASDDVLWRGSIPVDISSSRFVIEFGVLDSQAVFAVDGNEVCRRAYAKGVTGARPVSQPVAIDNESYACEIDELIIFRDLYYLDPASIGKKWEMTKPLGAEEYFVLGDNPSLSDDGRLWKNPAIPRDRIWGQVLSWSRVPSF